MLPVGSMRELEEKGWTTRLDLRRTPGLAGQNSETKLRKFQGKLRTAADTDEGGKRNR